MSVCLSVCPSVHLSVCLSDFILSYLKCSYLSSPLLSYLILFYLIYFILSYPSSTAQGGGGSFKNRKPIGEVGCCESGMAERSHWWTERCLMSPLFLSLSFSLCFSIFLWLSTYLPTDLSVYLPVCLSIYCCRATNYDAEAPSCRQKRQTRWRVQSEKTNTLARNELRMPSEKTNTKRPDRKRHTKGGGQNLVTQTMCLYC